MADQDHSKRTAETEQHKPVFILGMIWVIDQFGVFIKEDLSGFLKRNTMLLLIRGSFLRIPFKSQGHNYIVIFYSLLCKPPVNTHSAA